MNNKQAALLKRLPRFFALLLIFTLAISLFSACGKADAEAKKEKSKKSKSKKEKSKDAEEETDAKTDSESEEKTAAEEEEGAEKKSDTKKNKKDEKETGKTSDKSAEAEAVWNDLMKGNKRFMAGNHTPANYSKSRLDLVKGQKPLAIVLGCSDSRVPPELVFDKNLGELFVVRDAGNIIDEIALGSIEYAVEHLHAKLLIVLGHESCGAVAAAVSGEKMPTRNLRAIVETITPAFENSPDCTIGGKMNIDCVKLNAAQTSKDALLKSSIIKEAVEKGELKIMSAVYHLDSGEIVRLEENKK